MTQAIFRSACNPWNPGNHSSWGKLCLGFVWYKIVDRSWNRGGVFIGWRWSLKKSNTKSQSRATLVYNKKTFTIHFSKKNWATFRKRDLEFFVSKSASESPFYQVGEQKNPPGSYWTSMTSDLLTFGISTFAHTRHCLITHLCFCKDMYKCMQYIQAGICVIDGRSHHTFKQSENQNLLTISLKGD